MNDDNKTNDEYRRILDIVSRLEVIQNDLDSVIDFFSVPLVKLYSELCNDCLQLLFECEFKLDHYRMAEEFIWRRIYHVIYRFQKTKKQRLAKNDERLIESHFISGIGFYSTLIVRLRFHYKIHDVPGVISPLDLTLGPLDNFVDNRRLNEDDDSASETDENLMYIGDWDDTNHIKAKDWARQAIYRSLVYMGDLARYLMSTNESDYRKLAFNFYCSSSRFQPDYGLPFNQLATLAGGQNHSLDSVCNYMRCCLRPVPFDRAEGNMRQMFELNKSSYEQIQKGDLVSKISEVLASRDPGKAAESMMRAIVVTFIKLTSDLWNALSSKDHRSLLSKDKVIAEVIFFFENLREALELETIIPLTSLTELEQEFWPISGGSSSERNPRHVSPTIMYEFCSISIMLLAQCQKQQMSNEGTEKQADYIVDLVHTLALNLLYYSTSKCQKMLARKIRQLSINRNEQNSSDDLVRMDQSSSDSLEFESMLAYIYTQTHIPTIKIFCDWLLSDGSIINSNLDSFHTFHAELKDLVKLLDNLGQMTGLDNMDSGDQSSIYKHAFDGPTWLQKYPLSCDFPLFNLAPLKNVHMLNIYFNYQRELNESESGFISIQCLEAFLKALTVFLENKGRH